MIIKTAYDLLINAATVASFIDPANISTAWVTSDAFPRIILTYNLNKADEVITGGDLNIDIFTRGNSIEEAETISFLIKDVLQAGVYSDGRSSAIRFTWQNTSPITDEPGILHYSMIFSIRYVDYLEEA